MMSNREKAIELLEKVPEYKLEYVLAYLLGMTVGEDNIPNEETISAMKELEDGKGMTFDNLNDMWDSLEE